MNDGLVGGRSDGDGAGGRASGGGPDVGDGLAGGPDVGDGLAGGPDVGDGLAGGPDGYGLAGGPGNGCPGHPAARWRSASSSVMAAPSPDIVPELASTPRPTSAAPARCPSASDGSAHVRQLVHHWLT